MKKPLVRLNAAVAITNSKNTLSTKQFGLNLLISRGIWL